MPEGIQSSKHAMAFSIREISRGIINQIYVSGWIGLSYHKSIFLFFSLHRFFFFLQSNIQACFWWSILSSLTESRCWIYHSWFVGQNSISYVYAFICKQIAHARVLRVLYGRVQPFQPSFPLWIINIYCISYYGEPKALNTRKMYDVVVLVSQRCKMRLTKCGGGLCLCQRAMGSLMRFCIAWAEERLNWFQLLCSVSFGENSICSIIRIFPSSDKAIPGVGENLEKACILILFPMWCNFGCDHHFFSYCFCDSALTNKSISIHDGKYAFIIRIMYTFLMLCYKCVCNTPFFLPLSASWTIYTEQIKILKSSFSSVIMNIYVYMRKNYLLHWITQIRWTFLFNLATEATITTHVNVENRGLNSQQKLITFNSKLYLLNGTKQNTIIIVWTCCGFV